MVFSLWYRIARSLPTPWQSWAASHVQQAGLKEESAVWLAKSLFFVGIATLHGGFFVGTTLPFVNVWLQTLLQGFTLSEPAGILVGLLLGFILGSGLRYLTLYYAIDSRQKRVEDLLPDFLLLVAGNIRAGMTSFSALKSSSRPEFGALSVEFKSVTSRSL